MIDRYLHNDVDKIMIQLTSKTYMFIIGRLTLFVYQTRNHKYNHQKHHENDNDAAAAAAAAADDDDDDDDDNNNNNNSNK